MVAASTWTAVVASPVPNASDRGRAKPAIRPASTSVAPMLSVMTVGPISLVRCTSRRIAWVTPMSDSVATTP